MVPDGEIAIHLAVLLAHSPRRTGATLSIVCHEPGLPVMLRSTVQSPFTPGKEVTWDRGIGAKGPMIRVVQVVFVVLIQEFPGEATQGCNHASPRNLSGKMTGCSQEQTEETEARPGFSVPSVASCENPLPVPCRLLLCCYGSASMRLRSLVVCCRIRAVKGQS